LAAGGVPSLPVALQYPLAASLFCLSFTEWIGYYLRGRGLVVTESLVLAADCLIAFAFGAWALSTGAGPAGLAASQLAAHALAFGLAFVAARKLAPVTLAPPKAGDAGSFLKAALPTGAAILASIASWRLGTLALLWLSPVGTTDVVGLYSAAHRVLEGARFLPVAFAAAFFPGFARGGRGGGPFRLVFVMTAVAALASLALAFRPVAGAAVRVLLGPGFDAAPGILSVVFLAFPFLSANSVISQFLVATGRERTNAVVSLVHLACHAAALWILVPRLGALGAASALVVAEATTCAAGFVVLLTVARVK
jgi:O-antigen/teichoic acid export membrane protein